jgi:hypothetical protein
MIAKKEKNVVFSTFRGPEGLHDYVMREARAEEVNYTDSILHFLKIGIESDKAQKRFLLEQEKDGE